MAGAGLTHLVSPAPTAGPAPTAPAPPAPSAAAPGAPQVPEVDLQLGRDVVGGLAEVVIHDRVLGVGLQGQGLHQQGNGSKSPCAGHPHHPFLLYPWFGVLR